MGTKVVSTRIDETLIERLDEKAAAANVTRNELIAKLISDFIGSDASVDFTVDKSIQNAVDKAVDSRIQDLRNEFNEAIALAKKPMLSVMRAKPLAA